MLSRRLIRAEDHHGQGCLRKTLKTDPKYEPRARGRPRSCSLVGFGMRRCWIEHGAGGVLLG